MNSTAIFTGGNIWRITEDSWRYSVMDWVGADGCWSFPAKSVNFLQVNVTSTVQSDLSFPPPDNKEGKNERLKSTDISKEFCVYLFFKPYVNWVPVYLTWIWMTLHITWNVILSPNHLLSLAQPYPALNSTKPVLTSSLHILCIALLTVVLSAKCNIPLPLTPLLFILSIYL